MNYEYRCVAGPSNIGVKNDKERQAAVKEYETIINREAASGWEYVGVDDFSTTTAPGCFPGSSPQTVTMKMLVFKRQKS